MSCIVFVAFSFLLAVSCVDGNTEIGGVINSNANIKLTLSDHPYIVKEDYVIPNNSVLTIEAGVKVTFDDGVGLTVYGKIEAKGTQGNRVVLDFLPTPKSQVARLVDGNNRGEGRLELLVNGN